MQARFNERDNKTKGKWPMNRGRGEFQNFSERESQNSKNSTIQKGENNGNRASESTNSRGGNVRCRCGRKIYK